MKGYVFLFYERNINEFITFLFFKTIFTTLLTAYPALQNKHYLEEVDSEITMDKLFER